MRPLPKHLSRASSLWGASLFLLLALLAFAGCSETVATTDCQALVSAQNCPDNSAPQIYEDFAAEGSCKDGLYFDNEGKAQGTCKEESDCSFVCKVLVECPCGIASTTADGIECLDCSDTCTPNTVECAGPESRRTCSATGQWAESQVCGSGEICQSGACIGASTCNNGLHDSNETDVDCGGVCRNTAPCINGLACNVDGDCEQGVCNETNKCASPSCADDRTNGNETGIDCGGDRCDKCASGQGCNDKFDCENHVCESGSCAVATCSDEVKNQDETGLDCGGACAPCQIGEDCLTGADCETGQCSALKCIEAACNDGLQNQGETDIDCGNKPASGCEPCVDGLDCDQDSDCESSVCRNDTCQAPTCSDGAQNQGESAVDCGGAQCPTCEAGGGCFEAEDCENGVCNEGLCAASTCGDAVLQIGEDCDDGGVYSSACNADCTTSLCGDGKRNASAAVPEQCDDGNTDDDDGCSSTCSLGHGFTCTSDTPNLCLSQCGDGLLAVDESCDDDNTDPDDGCSTTCETESGWDCGAEEPSVCSAALCGDGSVAGDEECDTGGESATCDLDCTFVFCGDGHPNAFTEECDGGSANTADCNLDCTVPLCGDGIVNTPAGEACDDGDLLEEPCAYGLVSCNVCASDCSGLALGSTSYCGDSLIDTDHETCDAGGSDTVTCDSDCTEAICGDGRLNGVAGEVCDDGGDSSTCNGLDLFGDSGCKQTLCGDGYTNSAAGEACDDSGDSITCDSDCTASTCGDGYTNLTAGESCDDGNLIDNDACTNACVSVSCSDGIQNGSETDIDCGGTCPSCDFCGDSILQSSLGEACDEGGDTPTCDSDCTFPLCGDAHENLSLEECDGGVTNSVGCDTDCTFPVCGDGIANLPAGEACDDGDTLEGVCVYGALSCNVCNANCSNFVPGITSFCGDGFTDLANGEICDGGGETLGCDSDCTLVSCGDGHINYSVGEICDDGNTTTEICIYGETSCDVCDADCNAILGSTSYCGDGIRDTGNSEECDDGNDVDDDLCSNTCIASTCSDGVRNRYESAVDCGGSCAACSMIRIPVSGSSTTFEMGCPESDGSCEADQQPVHTVTISAFEMDPYEVTAVEYEACVSAGVCVAADTGGGANTSGVVGKENHPATGVDWDDASAYCGWVGKRLPTEAEWELAAKGETHRHFPWGDRCPASWVGACSDPEWTVSTANCKELSCNDGFTYTSSVGLFPDGVSPYGVYDMAGNVFEWTSDRYDSTYYSVSPSLDPTGPSSGSQRVMRGGAWITFNSFLSTSGRLYNSIEARYDYVGFRCVRSL